MAISYIRNKDQGAFTSAREIADHFELPFEILAKTLQRLKEQGIIASGYGTRGGYVLARDLRSLNLADFLGMMEGPLAVVQCNHENSKRTDADPVDHASCAYLGHCNIKTMMNTLNEKVHDFLHRISIEELTRAPSGRSTGPHTAAPAPRTGLSGLQGDEP